MSDQVFYITTPIYYPSDDPHIGHAYTTVAGDMLGRFRRQQGLDVYYLTGTDEHGQKMQRKAEEKGLTPLEFLDSIVPKWTQTWHDLDIEYDDFIRTTEKRHESAVEKFVQALHDSGDVYLGTYVGLYCVGCEGFKTEDELVEGKCPLHDLEPERIEEENYFFRLSKYQDRLIDLYTSTEFVRPEARRNEVLGKVRQGLDDLSMSRVSFDWGVPVPWDRKHVIYVWVDALLNYITAIGYGADQDRFEKIWPANIQLMSKDILWFHSVIWPAMLMALDLPLPRTVYAHGYLLVSGEKMSKTRLTSIAPSDLIETFGVDAFRYYFMRDIPFGNDSSFSWEGLAERYNADLANDFGNLASRVLNMAERYLDGQIPDVPNADESTTLEDELRAAHEKASAGIAAAMDEIAPHEALKAAWSFVRRANGYVEETQPWALAKDDAQRRRLEVVLYHLLDSLRLMAIMTWPAMPSTAQTLWDRLGIGKDVSEARLGTDDSWFGLNHDAKVSKGDALFPRIDESR